MYSLTNLEDMEPSERYRFPITQFLSSDINSTSAEDGPNKAETNVKILVLFAVILSVCVLVNSRIIYVMIINCNRSNRYVNLLVAQYSTIIYLYCDAFLIETFEKQLVNLFPLAGTGFCEALTFYQKTMNGAFPLNAVALTYERMRAIHKPFQKRQLIQTTCGIWLLAVLTNIPFIFMVKITKDKITKFEHCDETLLFKSLDVTMAYEWIRFFMFYVTVCFYMAYVIYRILDDIRSFHVLRGDRFRNRERWPKRLQFAFLHSVLFLLIWGPIGTIRFTYKMLCLLGEIEAVQQSPIVVLLEICSTCTLFIACPLLYVLKNRDVGTFDLLPRNVLRAICNESPLTVENVPTVTEDSAGDQWRIIPCPVATRSEGDGVNIAMSMLGLERSATYTDAGTSPIRSLTYNFDQNLTVPICVDCESERRMSKTVSWQE